MRLLLSLSGEDISDNQNMESESARLSRATRLGAAVRAMPELADKIKKRKEKIKKIQRALIRKYRTEKRRREAEKRAAARKRKASHASVIEDSIGSLSSDVVYTDEDFTAVALTTEERSLAKKKARALKRRILTPRQKLLRSQLLGAIKMFPDEYEKIKKLRKQNEKDQDKAWKAYVKAYKAKLSATK